jgi:sugar phosphate isomerase/epimerase
MQHESISRRKFIQGSTFTVAAFALSNRLAVNAANAPRLPVALQLYSVRGDCAKDFDAALDEVARMGFDGVEFAGYHKYDGKPAELRKRLDDLKLRVAATHIGTGNLRGDALKRAIDFHQVIGCRYLIVPGDGDFTNPEKCEALAETFNQAATTLKPLGMACGYHNHTSEFKKHGDTTFWDFFAQRTTRDVVLQQDCGWTAAAGLDPVEMMKRYPGRMKTTHFKPTVVNNEPGKKAFLGQDSVDWAAVIEGCRKFGGTEWITLEQEAYPDGKTPMECSAISFVALKKLLA